VSTLEFILKVCLPGLAIVGGWIWTAAKLYYSLQTLTDKVASIEKGRKELRDELRDDIDRKVRELESKLEDYESRFDDIRQSATDFAKDAELADFIVESARKWEEIQRVLGQLEGLLKASARGGFR
jgi:hypothetical protein